MASGESGPGLRKFREAAARGEYVDVLTLMDEFPEEALAIVDEVQGAQRAGLVDHARAHVARSR